MPWSRASFTKKRQGMRRRTRTPATQKGCRAFALRRFLWQDMQKEKAAAKLPLKVSLYDDFFVDVREVFERVWGFPAGFCIIDIGGAVLYN